MALGPIQFIFHMQMTKWCLLHYKYESLKSMMPCLGVALAHDTRFDHSWSNDAWFKHKLCKYAYVI